MARRGSVELDAAKSAAARDEDMRRAEEAALEEWKVKAVTAIIKVARAKAEFTSDDIWATGLEKPREPRALGPLLAALGRKEIIVKTGRYVPTAQVSRNGTDVAVWASLIYNRGSHGSK